MSRYPKLCKAIEYLVDKCGPIHGRTRLLKLVYLADHEWAKAHGGGRTYTEADYYRWNHGPFSREFLSALEWMDGVEIVETGLGNYESSYVYTSGVSTRLGDTPLDPNFQAVLDDIGQKWAGKPLRTLLEHVYGDAEFKTKEFGDILLR